MNGRRSKSTAGDMSTVQSISGLQFAARLDAAVDSEQVTIWAPKESQKTA